MSEARFPAMSCLMALLWSLEFLELELTTFYFPDKQKPENSEKNPGTHRENMQTPCKTLVPTRSRTRIFLLQSVPSAMRYPCPPREACGFFLSSVPTSMSVE
ncbi:hypothetical protein JOB18_000817 [Solea senegalensis]|uniref:Secreted protein n=1 Tax=Solea senegalensis TaxID=28829 RepID=A0AAV6Q4U7_SOLSE|nr:hypothetical protein JOB18_000817 [Solea senegalensis]